MVEARDVGLLVFPALHLPMACDATWGEGGTRRFPWTRGGLGAGPALGPGMEAGGPMPQRRLCCGSGGPPVAGEYADPEDL